MVFKAIEENNGEAGLFCNQFHSKGPQDFDEDELIEIKDCIDTSNTFMEPFYLVVTKVTQGSATSKA